MHNCTDVHNQKVSLGNYILIMAPATNPLSFTTPLFSPSKSPLPPSNIYSTPPPHLPLKAIYGSPPPSSPLPPHSSPPSSPSHQPPLLLHMLHLLFLLLPRLDFADKGGGVAAGLAHWAIRQHQKY